MLSVRSGKASWAAAFGLALLLLAPGALTPAAAQPKPYVYATNYPLAYFAARIGDGSFLALLPKQSGAPKDWRPSPADREDLRRAALVFVNGAGYESWNVADLVAPARLIDTGAGYEAPERAGEEDEELRPRPAGERERPGAPWLDLGLAIWQAAAIKQALLAARLGNPLVLESNFAELEAELATLDQRLIEALPEGKVAPVVAARPGYDYLARRYPFNVRSLDWSGHGIPSEAKMLELEFLLEAHPAKLMLWPELPDWPLRQRLEALGIAIVVMPTLERRPQHGDFLSAMSESIDRLLAALAETE